MKRLVICCDGTWSDADQINNGVPCPTNVFRLACHVAKRDGVATQVVHYDPGVGTGNVLDRVSGGAFGGGLEENIHDAYRFLAQNYERGDEIYLYGFSRGAYTARSTAGMIRKCGILRRESIVDHYRQALALYRAESHPDDAEPTRFRQRHSLVPEGDIPIKLIGVWDTVGALGIPLRGLRWITRRAHQFHDTELSASVEHAYHALAIDEHRDPFAPTLWAYRPKPFQTVEQVWFCGSHGDVGGGLPERGLSDLSLQWMLDKSQRAGLAIDREVAAAQPLAGSAIAPVHHSTSALYRMVCGLDRVIGIAPGLDGAPDGGGLVNDPTQGVHESVRQRWDSDPRYRPTQLRRYFERSGDPRI
ncbi:MAG: DUF2235 domain-containing protein [Polyangiales bacterium]